MASKPNMEGGILSSEMQVERDAERRVAVRRENPDRRFGERRSPERAVVGRRIQFVPDRRSEWRRSMDRPAFQPG